MEKCIVLDLDATVADCSHRIHHIKDGNRNWPAFFDGIPHDSVIEHTVEIAQAWSLSGSGKVVVLTGRPEKYRDTSWAWIQKNLPFPVEKLYMRSDTDFRAGPVTKVAALDQIRADGFNPIVAFDDHGGIVKAFRDAGLPCYHVTDADDDIPKKIWQGETFLTMLIGPSGAGKSTLTKEIPASWIVSSDEVRELKTPWRRADPDNEAVWASIPTATHAGVWRTIHDLIEARLRNGLPTVMDATNIKAADRKAVLALVPEGQRVRYLIVDRPLEDKIESRGWRPETLVRRMHESFQSGIKHAVNGDGNKTVDVVDLRKVVSEDRGAFARNLFQ